MNFTEFKLKIRKRIHYKLAKRSTVETYFLRVVDSSLKETVFNYNGLNLYARLKDSSDYDMIKQVIINGEYETSLGFFRVMGLEPKFIIDAGANIGLASLYFKKQYPAVVIACVEPDDDNYSYLSRNLNTFIKNNSIKLYKRGLMGSSNLPLNVNKQFRDGSHCARQVEVSTEGSNLVSITVNDILEESSFDYIDLLKIDIEGAERFLFMKDADLTYLNQTKVIAIEIHDEYNIKKDISKILLDKGFVLLDDSETTIGINTKFVSSNFLIKNK